MNLFQSIQIRKPKTNKFDLSHERKMSLKMGALYPILVQEVIPGDDFRVNTEILVRMAPMLAPVMHRVNIKTEYFFVPNRLIWDEWEDFITGGPQGTSAPIWPYVVINDGVKVDFQKKSLADYLGIPVAEATVPITQTIRVSQLPFRAYQLIWNEYYRDQNLQTEEAVPKGSGELIPGTAFYNMITLKRRAWEKDYLTSCLPWAQRGGEVGMPMDVVYKDQSEVKLSGAGTPATGNLSAAAGILGTDPGGVYSRIENIESVTETTINDLRKAVRLQEWLEKNARGGARYIEQILVHFGIKSSDARLQRPEYLGGGRQPMVISEVLSAYQSEEAGEVSGNPQGNMAGHGISVGKSNGFRKSFEEHGIIIGLVSVLPRTSYQQGLNRMFTRQDKFDYFWPEFANLGEQEVKNYEAYMQYDGLDPQNVGTFGYQSRYAEYKYKESTVHGDFKDNLDYWHMGRKFTAPPVLNSSFITADPTKRIYAVLDATEDDLYMQLFNDVSALRPMPYYGTPQL